MLQYFIARGSCFSRLHVFTAKYQIRQISPIPCPLDIPTLIATITMMRQARNFDMF